MELDAQSVAALVKSGATALSVALGSKPAALLVEKVSGALGWYMEPKQIVRRAQAEAASSLIKAEADQETRLLEQRTAMRILNEETKQQQNMENVVMKSLSGIGEDARPDEIDEDWLTGFFDRCRKVSDEEMQKLWAQILAGEANSPGKFSPRTLHEMSTLTKSDAQLFRRYSKFIWYYNGTKPMIIYPFGMTKSNFLGGLKALDMFNVVDMNIFIYNESKPFSFSTTDLKLSYNNHHFLVCQKIGEAELSNRIHHFPFGFVQMTQIGNELSSLLEAEPDFDYMREVIERWESDGFALLELPIPPVSEQPN